MPLVPFVPFPPDLTVYHGNVGVVSGFYVYATGADLLPGFRKAAYRRATLRAFVSFYTAEVATNRGKLLYTDLLEKSFVVKLV